MDYNKDLLASSIEQEVLAAYLSIRQPNAMPGMAFVEECKTTRDIQDDLSATLEIADSVIVEYMLRAGYVLKVDESGQPVWLVYRMR